jgi:hypothetical protein
MTRVTVTEGTRVPDDDGYPRIMQGVPNPDNVVLFISRSKGIRLRGPYTTRPLEMEGGFQDADNAGWWKPFIGTVKLDTTQ